MRARWILAGSVALAALFRPVTSLACGGCFHPPEPMGEVQASVITDHRMAFAISPTQTILWDQVRYQGNPSEFAWVLPVHEGARLELSHDAWLSALDVTTRAEILRPVVTCPPPPPGYYAYGGGGGGCAFGSASAPEANDVGGGAYDGGYASADAAYKSNPDVTVIEESVVGPYAVVILRASNGDALGPWLRANGFDVPTSVDPIVKAYDQEGFDFLALKLRPGANVQAMQPVRVITPGADLGLPLRMVTAGVGAHVGLELYVIGEGRYEPANFPKAIIAESQYQWNGTSDRSNYATLAAATMGAANGTTWLVESATRPTQAAYGYMTLQAAYMSACSTQGYVEVPVPCGPPQPDAGAKDASSDAEGGAVSPDSGCTRVVPACDTFDDLAVATATLHPADVVVTRLRADLPVAALATDLRLEGAADQALLSNVHQASGYEDGFDPCPKYAPRLDQEKARGGSSCSTVAGDDTLSSAGTALAAAFGLAAMLRRRRR